MGRKPRKLEIAQKVAESLVEPGNARNASIIARAVVDARTVERTLAKGDPSRLGADSIARLLAALSAVADSVLDAGVCTDADVARLMQLLAAFVGAAERLGRAGIDLSAALPDDAHTSLMRELRLAFDRGARAAVRFPRAARRRFSPQPGVKRGHR